MFEKENSYISSSKTPSDRFIDDVPLQKIPFKPLNGTWMVLGGIMAKGIRMVFEWFLNIFDSLYRSAVLNGILNTVESTTESCWNIIEWFNGTKRYWMAFSGNQWYTIGSFFCQGAYVYKYNHALVPLLGVCRCENSLTYVKHFLLCDVIRLTWIHL